MGEANLQTILAEIQQLRKELKITREELRITAKTFLTIRETALLIGWKEKSLRNRLSEKNFPLKPLRNGRRVLFKKEDVESYMSTLELAS
ncbi:MAG: hypothetical protein ACHQ2F_01120 [Desulfobaccales bacterium]